MYKMIVAYIIIYYFTNYPAIKQALFHELLLSSLIQHLALSERTLICHIAFLLYIFMPVILFKYSSNFSSRIPLCLLINSDTNGATQY